MFIFQSLSRLKNSLVNLYIELKSLVRGLIIITMLPSLIRLVNICYISIPLTYASCFGIVNYWNWNWIYDLFHLKIRKYLSGRFYTVQISKSRIEKNIFLRFLNLFTCLKWGRVNYQRNKKRSWWLKQIIFAMVPHWFFSFFFLKTHL